METSVMIAAEFQEALGSAGLDRFEQVMAVEAPPSSVTRAVPGRFTVRLELPEGRLELPGGGGRTGRVLYLKRYRGRLRASAAAHEWRRLHEAAAAGIPCPRPVALGERRGRLGVRESFLITEGLEGAEQADWWIAARPARKRELLEAVASLARRFHAAGFHHQDFYLCHFFVRERADGSQPGHLDLFLIDLQRCGRSGRLRWVVKDLAQLHRSLLEAGFAEEDWAAFLGLYGPLEPSVERAVRRKSLRIARHVPRYG